VIVVTTTAQRLNTRNLVIAGGILLLGGFLLGFVPQFQKLQYCGMNSALAMNELPA
jgi:hypothetical protein